MLSWSWHKPGYLPQNAACKKPYVVTVVKKETSRGMVKKFRPMSGGGGSGDGYTNSRKAGLEPQQVVS